MINVDQKRAIREAWERFNAVNKNVQYALDAYQDALERQQVAWAAYEVARAKGRSAKPEAAC